jgi:hypothetical protein
MSKTKPIMPTISKSSAFMLSPVFKKFVQASM